MLASSWGPKNMSLDLSRLLHRHHRAFADPPSLPCLTPRWFCHVDDDNYVNVRALLRLLASYPPTQDIYIGKPSLDRPIQATERVSEHKVVSAPPTHA